MTNACSKDEITLLYVGIHGEKTKSCSKDEITLKNCNDVSGDVVTCNVKTVGNEIANIRSALYQLGVSCFDC
jgi:hypothetical protein